MRIHDGLKSVELTQDMLIAAGGEGSVYLCHGDCYKIYHDATQVIAEDKIKELEPLAAYPHIMRPLRRLLDEQGRPCGILMRHLAGVLDLPPFFTRDFRKRRRVTRAQILHLVEMLAKLVASVHRHDILIVDLNELNFLVSQNLDDVYAIDVDSWQTKQHPVTVIMESVLDRHAKKAKRNGVSCPVWTQGTDWFAFGVVACQLFTGCHPYKGNFPGCHDPSPARRFEERMKKNLSIFRPTTILPPAAFPIKDVPAEWRAWFIRVFDEGERMPPPFVTQKKIAAAPATLTVAPAPVTTGQCFTLVDLYSPVHSEHKGAVWQILRTPAGELAVLYDQGAHYLAANGKWVATELSLAPLADSTCLFVTPRGRVLLALLDGDGRLVIKTSACPNATVIYTGSEANDGILAAAGRLFVKRQGAILGCEPVEIGSKVVFAFQHVANVLPAAHCYRGVVMQRLLNTWHATMLGACTWRRALDELRDYQVVDAMCAANVLIVIGLHRRTGRYDRFMLNVSTDEPVRICQDVGLASINGAVLDNSVTALMTDMGDVEVSVGNRPGTVELLRDSRVEGTLFSEGTMILLAKDDGTLQRLSRQHP